MAGTSAGSELVLRPGIVAFGKLVRHRQSGTRGLFAKPSTEFTIDVPRFEDDPRSVMNALRNRPCITGSAQAKRSGRATVERTNTPSASRNPRCSRGWAPHDRPGPQIGLAAIPSNSL